MAFTTKSTIEFVVSTSTVNGVGEENEPKVSNGNCDTGEGAGGEYAATGEGGGFCGGVKVVGLLFGESVDTRPNIKTSERVAESATITRFDTADGAKVFPSRYASVLDGRETKRTFSNWSGADGTM